MARRPQQRFTEDDFETLEGRASKTEQKKAVQRMAALGEQLSELNVKQIQKLPVEERLIDALLDVRNIKLSDCPSLDNKVCFRSCTLLSVVSI